MADSDPPHPIGRAVSAGKVAKSTFWLPPHKLRRKFGKPVAELIPRNTALQKKDLKAWLPALTIIAISVLLQAIPGAVDALRYQADANSGEPWRLVTGHWVHLGWMHLVLNAAGIALLAILFAPELKPVDWIATMTLMPLAISLGFMLRNPQLQWYVGLSGVLHGLMFTGCLLLWQTQKRMAAMIAIVVIAKIAHEQWAGAESGTEQLISGNIVVDAHLYGALAGLAWGTTRLLIAKARG